MEEIGQAQEREYQRVVGVRQERLAVADRVIAREKALVAEFAAVRCVCACVCVVLLLCVFVYLRVFVLCVVSVCESVCALCGDWVCLCVSVFSLCS